MTVNPQKESMELNMIEREKEKENEEVKMKFSEVVVEGNNLWNFLTWHGLQPIRTLYSNKITGYNV